eukprot:TRINITY_DN20529_c0_g1_i1.p2 TRINITY_DN20529_c0_g1~~TRINITY_DN20529_c0_g1_i1.p2  ORF type:complete len:164 (+),score=15.17 TRINITY_DN20529_c0_g1_i1:99-590(+)
MFFFFLMIRRPPRSTHCISSAASDVYKRQYIYIYVHTRLRSLTFYYKNQFLQRQKCPIAYVYYYFIAQINNISKIRHKFIQRDFFFKSKIIFLILVILSIHFSIFLNWQLFIINSNKLISFSVSWIYSQTCLCMLNTKFLFDVFIRTPFRQSQFQFFFPTLHK